ncbi:UDP-N-acetylglucosamine 2-epimerase [Gammaproteobacteria bacterium]|nr:UDP-N-acetylglucosamine 2-epimerase [Gammaproteobacteria bacterium]
MMKTVCVVTGTRAEYGLLRWVMEGIEKSPSLNLQLVVTGMHLSPEFGLTVNEIKSHGFVVDRCVEMLVSSDTPTGITKSIGLGLTGFADVMADLEPDLVLILGDRYEILAAAISAMIARVPLAHLHGGEATEGSIDEAIRHSITKMSHLHFVATDEYRNRVIQLGEQPDNVYQVGGLGIDNISNLELLDRKTLEESLGFHFKERNLLITFHPVTLESKSSQFQMAELLASLDDLEDTYLIFTMPNSDTDGRILFQQIEKFVSDHKNASVFTSLGQLKYLSCIAQVDAVIGNSSSGLTEAPSFKKATINIGDRQRGRMKAASVIDCLPERSAVTKALEKIYLDEFQQKLNSIVNPYGEGGASELIIEILESANLDYIVKKSFYDINFL